MKFNSRNESARKALGLAALLLGVFALSSCGGGGSGTNYHPEAIAAAAEALQKADLPHRVMVDCSHGNSNKDHNRQGEVAHNVLAQRLAGNDAIIGIMLESHLFAGRQDLIDGKAEKYGVSVTDACIDWDSTVELLASLHQQMLPVQAVA